MEHTKVVEAEYKGNKIFRQQPNHSYFDKPFDDEEDCLFQILHEIDPYFLKPERKAEEINFINATLTDPRTKKPINKICYDHTKEQETAIFISPRKSFMKVEEHELGVRVLNCLQQRLEVEEEDMYNWYRLQKLRLREKDFFQKFVFEYCQNNKEGLYAPCRKLLELYQKWYSSKSVRLIKRYPHENYNTYLGLPQVRQCKNVLSDRQAHITNPEIVVHVGEQSFCLANVKKEYKQFNHNLESYAKVFENSEDLKEALEDELKQKFEKIIEQAVPESPFLYMPLESLLFLITAGDYVDLPTEMLLNIKEVDYMGGESRKYIIMDLPLPSRQGGWHTYEEVVEQALLAMSSIKQMQCLESDMPDTNASLDYTDTFKVVTLKDFIENCNVGADKLCKFSKSLSKWQLSTTDDEMNFQIYSSFDLCDKRKCITLKLEYKPRFGCETLTKYRALKEWFKLKLIGATECSCLRLDVSNFQTLLEETLSIVKLEEILSSTYKIKCNELLNNLIEFLKMLYGMPLGHYMLRYNPKFKDKLLLCKPSQELTQNTVHLHQLISSQVTDFEFISQPNFLPIDENLCNIMHLEHKILPAAFSPFFKGKPSKNIAFNSKQRNNLLQTRKQPTKLDKQHKILQNNIKDKKPTNRTKIKRANRKRRKLEALKAKSNELNEINEMKQEIELDRLMLNNL